MKLNYTEKRNDERRGEKHKADAALTNPTSTRVKNMKSAATPGLHDLPAAEAIINTKAEETPADHLHMV